MFVPYATGEKEESNIWIKEIGASYFLVESVERVKVHGELSRSVEEYFYSRRV